MSRGAWAVALAAVALHIHFAWVDARIPPDMGLFYRDVPALHAHWDPAAALAVGGWYQLVIAGLLRLVGVGPFPVHLVQALGVGACVAAAGALGGARGALVVAGIPAVVTLGRVGWVHVPEAALLLAAVAAWERDPELRRSGLALGALGALAVLLRPTALGWLLLLGPALGWTAGRRAGPVVGAWAVAALPAFVELRPYLLAKLVARDRYVLDVPDLLGQVPSVLGVLPLLFGGLGLVVGLGRALRARALPPVDALLLGWTVLPAALFLGFRAGIDNFTVGLCALALFGARAWGPARLATAASVLVFAVPVTLELAPAPAPDSFLAQAANRLGLPAQQGLKNYAVPFRGWSAADVRTLVEQICPGGRSPTADRPCALGSVQGVFRPHGEDAGHFELFLVGLGGVRLAEAQSAPVSAAELDALVTWSCPWADGPWFRRYPGGADAARALVRDGALLPVWTRRVDPGCAVTWWTRPNVVADPSRLPPSDALDTVHLPDAAAPGAGAGPAGPPPMGGPPTPAGPPPPGGPPSPDGPPPADGALAPGGAPPEGGAPAARPGAPRVRPRGRQGAP